MKAQVFSHITSIGILVLCALFLGQSQVAQGSDFVLLLDTSGSMHETDPASLGMITTGQILNGLGEGDRMAVISFDRKALVKRPLTPVAPDELDATIRMIREIPIEGELTDLSQALKRGKEILVDSAPGWNAIPRCIILFSDAIIDLEKNEAGNAAERNRILKNLVPMLNKENVKVFSFRYSNKCDAQLLKAISSGTGGKSFSANNEHTSSQAVKELFARVKSSQMTADSDTHPTQSEWFDASLKNHEGIMDENIVIEAVLKTPDTLRNVTIIARVSPPDAGTRIVPIYQVENSLFASAFNDTHTVGEYAIEVTGRAIDAQTGRSLELSRKLVYRVKNTPATVPAPVALSAKTKPSPPDDEVSAAASTAIVKSKPPDKASGNKPSSLGRLIAFILFNAFFTVVIVCLYKNKSYFQVCNLEEELKNSYQQVMLQ